MLAGSTAKARRSPGRMPGRHSRRWSAIASWIRQRGLWAPVALAALVVGFYWKMLFLGRTIGGLDALDYFYPYRAYAAAAIQHGRLPLWNPDIFGGVPFLANIQAAVFYPLSGLF